MRYLILLLSILCFSCQEKQRQPNSEESTEKGDRLAIKNIPNDQFYLQRSYPDGQFNLKAFEKGMTQARQLAAQRGVGFDDEWTVQGPGNIGARINTIAIHPADENIIYVGYSQGGVWKTVNGGQDWVPIFDDQPYPSIGDITIDPSNPETIYVGTGDPNISGYPWIGDGIWRSQDGGDTWEHIGLEAERIISKVIVHPTDPNIIYASAMGLPFVRNNNRGLYKSSDGGQSWEQVLFISDQAGITDFVMDPFEPETLYAAGWDRIRNNHESVIWGPGSQFFKSTDGGETWSQMTNGLPIDEQGRTALAISEQTPGVLYALVNGTNSRPYGVYRTNDAGDTWESIDIAGIEGETGGFGWYFGDIRIDPNDDNLLYFLDVELWGAFVSGNSASWFTIGPPWWWYEVHADKHDLVWANGNMYLATDGGLYRSSDMLGYEWDDMENIPTTQFYRVAYNPHQPNWHYGGAQDNGTTGGNANNINEWPRIYGGDGFQAAFHPDNPNVFYAETQNGGIVVTLDGGDNFSSATSGLSGDDRRNWDMPYFLSPHNPDVIYTGTYRVYRSVVGAVPDFAPISEDLSDGLILNQRYHTITTLSESPIEEGLLYVGTVDANVWRSPDGGANWEQINATLPEQYVTEVKASPDFEDWVYVTHSGYKENEFLPHIHRSKDRGETWEAIHSDLPEIAINDVYILPGHADTVLFVGTDAGVYGSLNSGENWKRLGTNMPFVPTYDLEWNVSENTLIAGTHARSIMTYPIDSLLYQEPIDSVVFVRENLVENEPLKIFPNPAVNYFNVEIPASAEKGTLTIFDLNGRSVNEYMVESSDLQTIEIGDLTPGNYVVKYESGAKIWRGRLVKK